MTENTLTAVELTRFYRDVMLPDFERVIENAFERFDQHEMRSGCHRILARLDRILMMGITIDLDSLERQLSSRRAPRGDLCELVEGLYGRLEQLDSGLRDIVGSEQEFALRSEVRGLRTRYERLRARLETRLDD